MPKNLRLAFFEEDKNFVMMSEQDGVKFYKKQILAFGTWKHPDNRDIEFEITKEVVQQIADNFAVGVPLEAPIVLTHTDDPKSKVGGVKQFVPTEKGLDAVFSIADKGMSAKIDGEETTPGVSCWLDLNYKDKKTNKEVGAVVKHVALVNHPYIEGLGKFEAVSLSEDKEAEQFVPLVMGEKNKFRRNTSMKLEEFYKKLKDEHKIDVAQLQEDLKVLNDKVEKGELIEKKDAPALSEELIAKIQKKLKLAEKTSPEDTIKALVEAIEKTMKLSEEKETDKEKADKRIADLESEIVGMKGEKEIDGLITEGKVLPAEKDAFLSAYKKDKSIYDELVKPRTVSLVELAEKGKTVDESDEEDKKKEQKLIDEQVELAEKEGLAVTAKT